MKTIEFKEQNTIIAEKQPEYLPIPAYYNKKRGSMTMCLKLNENELNRVKATGEVWLQIITSNRPMQPINTSTNKEDLLPKRLWMLVDKAENFNLIAEEIIDDYLDGFPPGKGLTRKPTEEDFEAFEDRDLTFMFTQKGMKLYHRACERLTNLGKKLFPDGHIEVKGSRMLFP